MLTRLRLYREYRRQGLYRAWHYAGMGPLAWSVAKYVAASVLAVSLAVLASRKAEAIQEDADNRSAARIATLRAENYELRSLLAKCLGDRDGSIIIGGEVHLCRAIPTGIRP